MHLLSSTTCTRLRERSEHWEKLWEHLYTYVRKSKIRNCIVNSKVSSLYSLLFIIPRMQIKHLLNQTNIPSFFTPCTTSLHSVLQLVHEPLKFSWKHNDEIACINVHIYRDGWRSRRNAYYLCMYLLRRTQVLVFGTYQRLYIRESRRRLSCWCCTTTTLHWTRAITRQKEDGTGFQHASTFQCLTNSQIQIYVCTSIQQELTQFLLCRMAAGAFFTRRKKCASIGSIKHLFDWANNLELSVPSAEKTVMDVSKWSCLRIEMMSLSTWRDTRNKRGSRRRRVLADNIFCVLSWTISRAHFHNDREFAPTISAFFIQFNPRNSKERENK